MIERWIETGLLIGGLITVDIWIWANAGSVIYQSWAGWAFERELRHEPATVSAYLAAEKEEISRRIESFLGIQTYETKAPVERMVPKIVPRLPVPPNGLVGRLTIPRLGMTGMVREGTGEDTLSLTLGHIPGTALPGEPGNVGIAGHRDELFRGLRHIRRDDLIVLETLGGNYTYQVESTTIVKPKDVGVLRAGQGAELTLVTCYPFYYVGSAPDRFIVKARQVSRPTAAASKSIG